LERLKRRQNWLSIRQRFECLELDAVMVLDRAKHDINAAEQACDRCGIGDAQALDILISLPLWQILRFDTDERPARPLIFLQQDKIGARQMMIQIIPSRFG
jgi:hypothetical protein